MDDYELESANPFPMYRKLNQLLMDHWDQTDSLFGRLDLPSDHHADFIPLDEAAVVQPSDIVRCRVCEARLPDNKTPALLQRKRLSATATCEGEQAVREPARRSISTCEGTDARESILHFRV